MFGLNFQGRRLGPGCCGEILGVKDEGGGTLEFFTAFLPPTVLSRELREGLLHHSPLAAVIHEVATPQSISSFANTHPG